MTIDPVDDCTFWFTSTYFPSQSYGAQNLWHTRIGAFRFSNCPPQPAPPPATPQAMRVSGLVQRILPPFPSENIFAQQLVPVTGTRVEALVGDTVCGSAVSVANGRFELTVAADPPARGCGRPGLTVTFRVSGMVVGEPLPFRSGGAAAVALRLPVELVPELIPRP